jgi:hypothetical protein
MGCAKEVAWDFSRSLLTWQGHVSAQRSVGRDRQGARGDCYPTCPRLFIVHDRNRRAMTKHVMGLVSAQSWFQNFSTIRMENEDPAASFD